VGLLLSTGMPSEGLGVAGESTVHLIFRDPWDSSFLCTKQFQKPLGLLGTAAFYVTSTPRDG